MWKKSNIKKMCISFVDIDFFISNIHIYANILTLMGIFVSVFSLITVNFSNLGKSFANTKYVAVMNLSLGIVICLFLGLIMFFINHKTCSKKMIVFYGVIMVVLIAVLLGVLLL